MVSQPQNRLLALSFHKDIAEPAFFDFEKQLLFGLMEVLTYFSSLEFLDAALSEDRKGIARPFFQESQAQNLRWLASQLESRFVLYGALSPEVGPTGYMDALDVEVCLFDATRNTHALHLTYSFSSFTDFRVTPTQFTPSWGGFQDLLYWLAFEIMGVMAPDQLRAFARLTQSVPLADGTEPFQKLCGAYYLTSDNTFPQKLSLLFGLSQDHPDMFLVHLELGDLYKRLNSYHESLKSFERAYRLMAPVMPHQLASCATEIGVCHALLEEFEEACDWWRTAIQVAPRYLNPYMNLAHYQEEQGDIAGAEALFLQAAEINPEDSRIYFNLARLYSKLEQWDKVAVQYEHQRLLEPDNPWVVSNLANCCLQKGDLPTAKKYLLRTLELDPHGEAGKTAHFILLSLEDRSVEA